MLLFTYFLNFLFWNNFRIIKKTHKIVGRIIAYPLPQIFIHLSFIYHIFFSLHTHTILLKHLGVSQRQDVFTSPHFSVFPKTKVTLSCNHSTMTRSGN